MCSSWNFNKTASWSPWARQYSIINRCNNYTPNAWFWFWECLNVPVFGISKKPYRLWKLPSQKEGYFGSSFGVHPCRIWVCNAGLQGLSVPWFPLLHTAPLLWPQTVPFGLFLAKKFAQHPPSGWCWSGWQMTPHNSVVTCAVSASDALDFGVQWKTTINSWSFAASAKCDIFQSITCWKACTVCANCMI